MSTDCSINIQEKLWLEEDSKIEENIRNLTQLISPQTSLEKLLQQKIKIEISFLLTNDQEIKELNANYCQKNKATNVLSFPVFDTRENPEFNIQNLPIIDNFLILGDIALSYQTIKKECEEQNKTFQNHLTHLLTHSILHLLGYDHETEKQANKMENLEIKILKKLAIPNPYVV